MKFREMSRLEIFRKDVRKCGIIYASLWLFDLPYAFDNSKSRCLRCISDKAFDWCDKKLRTCCASAGRRFSPLEYVIYEPASNKTP